jgi:hypothetical protein
MTVVVAIRCCTECSREFPETEEYFYKDKTSGYLRRKCLECCKAKMREYGRNVRSRSCSVEGCHRNANESKHGYCGYHRRRNKICNGNLNGELPRERKWKQAKLEGKMTGGGCRLVHCPGHPEAYSNEASKRNCSFGWALEHRYVMSNHLGRALKDNENVHHKNGIKTDNRLENLELWVKTQPCGQRAEDIVAWARQMIDMYGALFDEVHGTDPLRRAA